jgi:ParB family transcriptional regulator, chromosome partitioning protein
MTKRTAFSLTSTFSEATATLQQQQELNRLRKELEKLRAEQENQREEAISAFREELKNYSGEQLIFIEAMRPTRQARQTIPLSVVRKRAESLKRLGQLNPVILVPVVGEIGVFSIEDGELRWRAAKLLVDAGLEDWKTLRAVIAPPPIDEVDLHKRSLIHNLHREDLNPLDRIEAIINYINSTINLELESQELEEARNDHQQAIVFKLRKIIRNLDYRFKKNQQERAEFLRLLEASSEEQRLVVEQLDVSVLSKQVLLVFLELQLNLCSVAANDLPMLTLPFDLKQAIRISELPCRQALVLAKLTQDKLGCSEVEAVQLRFEVTEQVVARTLSLTNTRKLVEQILEKQGTNHQIIAKKVRVAQVKAMLSQVSLQDLNKEDLKSLRSTLVEKLHELEKLLV